MNRKRPSATAISVSLGPIAGRILVFLLITLSLALLIASKTHNANTGKLRMLIADATVPIVNLLAKPADAIAAGEHWVNEMMALRENNRVLTENNTRLLQWQSVAKELQSENDKLRALLKFAPVGKSAYTSARIAIDPGSPYVHSALITSGSNQGVQEDSAVINENGLVGRIVDVGKKTSRVLLLTDMNSRIPVVSETSRERAIAGGGNGDQLSLLYLPENSTITAGETIVTSGDGGVLPPGLPVGIVTKVEKGGVTVKPFVDWYHLEYVSIVDFSM